MATKKITRQEQAERPVSIEGTISGQKHARGALSECMQIQLPFGKRQSKYVTVWGLKAGLCNSTDAKQQPSRGAEGTAR